MDKEIQRQLMNQFIQKIKLIVKADPSLLENPRLLSDTIIYNQLTTFNLGKSYEKNSLEDIFSRLINRNKENVNSRTFINPDHSYFCQVVSKDYRNLSEAGIKLYIPLDYEHIYMGSNKLFDFIDKEGISHNSKISKEVRNDDIVVRTTNIEEAEKIINYISQDSYIREGLLNINPFTLNIEGVGISKDGNYSYNSVVCEMLVGALSTFYNANRIDDLNIDTFEEYLQQFNILSNPEYNLILTILKRVVSKKEFSLDDFKKIVNVKPQNKEEILKNAIIETIKEYGLEITVDALSRFRYNGDLTGFTRKNGARKSLSKISIEDVNEILSNSNIESNKFLEDYIKSVTGLDKIQYLKKAFTITSIKYGTDHANRAIYNYIVKGDAGFFTDNRQVRSNLLKNVSFTNLRTLLIMYLGLDDYCTNEEIAMHMIENLNQGKKVNDRNLFV